MKKAIPNKDEYIMQDGEGNVVPAFETDKKNAKKNLTRTSTGYTVFAVILYILTFMPIAGMTLVLAFKTRELLPYYGIWPFVGTIVVGVFALVFYLVLLLVARKHSKKSIMTQTAILAIVYTLCTTVFSLAITYAFPDAIAVATQNTIYGEDVLYKADKMVETNAQLERDYIMYNILNGNLGGELSYHDLSAHRKESGAILSYDVDEIESSVRLYMYATGTPDGKKDKGQPARIQANIEKLDSIIETIKETNPRKYEMYKFVYEQYVLNDPDYAFLISGNDARERKALALAIVDYEYNHSRYEELLVRGFTNNATDPDPELNAIFNRNYNNFNHDGYITFDDEHLLLAQVEGRMTIPVVVHLILDNIYQYTQPSWNDAGDMVYEEGGNFLYQLYDPYARDEFLKESAIAAGVNVENQTAYTAYVNSGAAYAYTDEDGNKYGYTDKGWRVYPDGMVHRPIKWVVLDMLGEGMALTSLDISNLNLEISGIKLSVSTLLPVVSDVLGAIVNNDLPPVLEVATNGASIGLGLRLNDEGMLEINIVSNNVKYGMLGYMQATWVSQDNLLMAVYNVVAVRNWFALFGAIGVVLVIGAGVLRDCGKKIRERGAITVDRLNRMRAKEEYDEENAKEADLTSSESPAETPKADAKA